VSEMDEDYVEVRIKIRAELAHRMKGFPEVNWDYVFSQAIQEYIDSRGKEPYEKRTQLFAYGIEEISNAFLEKLQKIDGIIVDKPSRQYYGCKSRLYSKQTAVVYPQIRQRRIKIYVRVPDSNRREKIERLVGKLEQINPGNSWRWTMTGIFYVRTLAEIDNAVEALRVAACE
jgi:hypothetical protein